MQRNGGMADMAKYMVLIYGDEPEWEGAFDDHDGQIVSARVALRSRADGDRRADPAGQWVRAGLPFLTPAVRAAFSERVERSRVERRSWHGVVAGTPVDIVAGPGNATTSDGRAADPLDVTIGVPLLFVK